MSLYDDWVYIGKETYGSRHVSGPAKFSTKFFDVLGRAYGKIVKHIKQYVFKDTIEKSERNVALEFEVYMRIIEDSDGNDVRVFVKEDKANGLRKDSSFYSDGSWEVFEKESSGVARLRASDGTVSWSRYDDKNRLTESYLLDSKGDTLISEQYEWKNGRLAKTIIDGVARNYIYGKTLRDTVRVIPPDNWTRDYYNSGYNGTAGKMPEEGTPEYGIFARWPYGYALSEESSGTSFAAKSSASSLNVLQKRINTTGSCVDKELGMPSTFCIRDEFYDINQPNSEASRRQGKYGWPGNGDFLAYGSSTFSYSFTFECECNSSGKYQPFFRDYTDFEEILIKESTWKYNREREFWYEFCWYRPDLNKTYRHEVQHIRNARKARDEMVKFASIYNINAPNTPRECKEQGNEGIDWILNRFEEWKKREYEHINLNSPEKYSGYRNDGYICN